MTDGEGIESGLDVLLVLLNAKGNSGKDAEPIKGITRLQKLLFLLWKEAGFYEQIPDLYGFNAYDFGPCMDDLYDDIDFATDIGLVKVDEVPSGNEYAAGDENAFLQDFGFRLAPSAIRRDYSLTEKGREAAAELCEQLSEDDIEDVRSVKTKFNRMPFFELLKYVYQKYPNFAKKSILSL